MTEEECDHEWEFEDASFDHEFGTEVVHVWQCLHCEKVVNENPHGEIDDN